MKIQATIKLDAADIKEALIQYATGKLDLGVKFSPEDVSICSLKLSEAVLDVVPGRHEDTTE